ncbi:hypothetical protein GCM10018771_36160 [Streptomyces cellulosae]|nr:hypothetical protein GCM10018771_36160 [Streptomyces cellulosae]
MPTGLPNSGTDTVAAGKGPGRVLEAAAGGDGAGGLGRGLLRRAADGRREQEEYGRAAGVVHLTAKVS